MRSNLLVLALTLLLFAIGAEFLLRATCTYCSYTERNGGVYVSPYQVPRAKSWYEVIPAGGSYKRSEFDYERRINALGLRDVEPVLAKPPDTFRIIGIGDSFTEGVGAAYEETYLNVLAKNLNASPDPIDVSVMSAGVAGSDPVFGYVLLRDKLMMFRPDLIILAINDSDVSDVIVRGGNERFLSDGSLQYAEPPADEWLYALSHFYRFVKTALLGYDALHLRRSERKRRISEAVDDIGIAVAAFRGLANREGSEFMVVLHPMLHELRNGEYGLGMRKVKQHLEEEGIPFVDLLTSYLASNVPPSSLYWEIDGHHNARGYALFAEGVEAYLRAHEIVPGR